MRVHITDYMDNDNERDIKSGLLVNHEYIEKGSRLISIKVESCDTYSLDYTLAYIIKDCLIAYKNKIIERGIFKYHSESIEDDKYDYRWVAELDEMIAAFDEHANDIESLYAHLSLFEYQKKVKEHRARIQKGINLFAERFMDLWW